MTHAAAGSNNHTDAPTPLPTATEALDGVRAAASATVEATVTATKQTVQATKHAAKATKQAANRLVTNVKPKLRGWIHAITAPLAFAAGIVLIVLTPSPLRWTSTIFASTSVILFGMSAVYHRGRWNARVAAVLRRFDHANIFLLIAGTYTPLSVVLLPHTTAITVLAIVWTGAIGGILMKIFWMDAPRWLYVPIYIALGWVAIWFLPAYWNAGGPAIVWLILAGGIAYTIGAAAYGLKRPNPVPGWFGFHEVFHLGTVIGWTCHFIAVMMVML